MDTEQSIIELIVNSGESRSFAFEALASAKEGNFELARELMSKSEASAMKAHTSHMQLLQREASGEAIESSMLLMHSQDHMMAAMLAKELIEELIENKKEIYELKESINKKNV